MDQLEDHLKDLITYVNENSEFDIFAVQIELYKHGLRDRYTEALRSRGQERAGTRRPRGKLWNWELLKERLRELGNEEVEAAQQVIDWAEKNKVEVSWATSQRGGFILCFYTPSGKGFYPFGITGTGKVEWNAPHQEDKSPTPFDKPENRAEILKRLRSIKGAIVDPNNVDGYAGLRLPLRLLADKEARDTFFSVCLWIEESLREGRVGQIS